MNSVGLNEVFVQYVLSIDLSCLNYSDRIIIYPDCLIIIVRCGYALCAIGKSVYKMCIII